MHHLIKIDSMIQSECNLILDTINQKLRHHKSLTFQEIIIYKIRTFLHSPYVNLNDNMDISTQNVTICAICDNICYKNEDRKFICCNICNDVHMALTKYFVICKDCVNIYAKIDVPLAKNKYCCNNTHYYSFTYLPDPYISYLNHYYVSKIMTEIINNPLKLIDRFYDFNHKITLLLILSYCDINSYLNIIPKDVTFYVLHFIYYNSPSLSL